MPLQEPGWARTTVMSVMQALDDRVKRGQDQAAPVQQIWPLHSNST